MSKAFSSGLSGLYKSPHLHAIGSALGTCQKGVAAARLEPENGGNGRIVQVPAPLAPLDQDRIGLQVQGNVSPEPQRGDVWCGPPPEVEPLPQKLQQLGRCWRVRICSNWLKSRTLWENPKSCNSACSYIKRWKDDCWKNRDVTKTTKESCTWDINRCPEISWLFLDPLSILEHRSPFMQQPWIRLRYPTCWMAIAASRIRGHLQPCPQRVKRRNSAKLRRCDMCLSPVYLRCSQLTSSSSHSCCTPWSQHITEKAAPELQRILEGRTITSVISEGCSNDSNGWLYKQL